MSTNEVDRLKAEIARLHEIIDAAVLLKHFCCTPGKDVPSWAKAHPDYPSNNKGESGVS